MENEHIFSTGIEWNDGAGLLPFQQKILYDKLPIDLKESVTKAVRDDLSFDRSPWMHKETQEFMAENVGVILESKDLFNCIIGERVRLGDELVEVLAYSLDNSALMVEAPEGVTKVIFFEDVVFERSLVEEDGNRITDIMEYESWELLAALLRKESIMKLASQGAAMDQDKILQAVIRTVDEVFDEVAALSGEVLVKLEEEEHVG